MRKGRFIALIGSLFLLCVSLTCFNEDENNHCFIRFSNRSSAAIYIDYDGRAPEYKDTIPPAHSVSSGNAEKVNPNEINMLAHTSWESVFTDKRYATNDTLMIYVLDAAKAEAGASPKEALIARYDVTLNDLKRNHWLLSYPPNGQMDNIRMWPPYSSYNQTGY